jgi:hypothetical protein
MSTVADSQAPSSVRSSAPRSERRGARRTSVRRVERRSEKAVRSLLGQAGLRSAPDAEVEHLLELLMHKFAHDVEGEEATALDALAIRGAFLRYRLLEPVVAYERGHRFYAYLDTWLNLTSIAAGIAASLAAALGAPKGLPIMLGVLIAACQTFSQWLKPAQRATRRGQAVFELKGESWNLLQSRDRYRDKSCDQAWNIFCAQVDRLEEREDAAQDKELSDTAGSAGGGHGQAAAS